MKTFYLMAIPAIMPAMAACSTDYMQVSSREIKETSIELSAAGSMESRSADPQENLVTDMNIFIFNDRGEMEADLYMESGQMQCSGDTYTVRTSLLDGGTYSIYAFANAGYNLDYDSENAVKEMKYYLTYPDEFRTGIPMSGKTEKVRISGNVPVRIQLERTMSKISLGIDRSRLSDDVVFHINSVSIGGCPKSVRPFTSSSAESEYDTFIKGFSKSGMQVSALNEDYGNGKSGEVSVYMFENMQGNLLEGISSDSGKVLPPSHPKADVCSYIEIRADYASDSHYTLPGDELIYRFYLGEDRENFDVCRNTHYHFTVTPENDGLGEDSWRVDKSGLNSYSPYYMKVYPGTFIRGKIDESFHIRCEFYPASAPFDIGIEELEYDRKRGIYDYKIDDDGTGVTLWLKKRGSGMLYFETGHPVNQSEIITVIVE